MLNPGDDKFISADCIDFRILLVDMNLKLESSTQRKEAFCIIQDQKKDCQDR